MKFPLKTTFIILLLLLFLAACGGGEEETADVPNDSEPTAEIAEVVEPTREPAKEATAVSVPTDEPAPEPTAEPAAAQADSGETDEGNAAPAVEISADAGMACFGTRGSGLSCLTADGEWQAYTSDSSALGGDYITAMTNCSDGTLLISHTSGISALSDGSWREYDSDWGYSSADALACDADGGFWVAHFEGVSHFDGSTWTTHSSSLLATGEHESSLVEGVAVAPDGTIWAATANSIASYDGNTWTVYQPGQGFDDLYFFDAITVDAKGQPWAGHSGGLLTLADGTWNSHESSSFYTVQTIAVGHDDQWIGSFSSGLFNFDGASWAAFDRSSGALDSDKVNVVKVDGNGRVWAGTEWGLSVYDGSEWTTYHMDNAELLDNSIDSMIIIDGGPALPESLAKAPGAMSGSLTLDGEIFAAATVEICIESLYSSYEGDTPCSDQALFFSTTTDAEGQFSFSDVPVGRYVITVDTGDGWAQLTGDFGIGSELVPVDAGEETDVGELTITSE